MQVSQRCQISLMSQRKVKSCITVQQGTLAGQGYRWSSVSIPHCLSCLHIFLLLFLSSLVLLTETFPQLLQMAVACQNPSTRFYLVYYSVTNGSIQKLQNQIHSSQYICHIEESPTSNLGHHLPTKLWNYFLLYLQ